MKLYISERELLGTGHNMAAERPQGGLELVFTWRRPTKGTSVIFLKGQCHEIFCFWFFHKTVSPQPQSIPLGPFQIFSEIRGDIRK
jgi:hypothetical protein